MTDADLLTLIKNNASFKEIADEGQDNALAYAINAAQPAAVPLTTSALAAAAPQTLAALAADANYIQNLDTVVGARIRENDATGVGAWAATLHMLGKMPDAEYSAVEKLVTAAMPPDTVTHEQVSRVLNAIRPVGEHGQTVATPITWN